MRVMLLLAGLVLAAPLTAQAQPVSEPQGPDTYLHLQAGAFLPRRGLSDLENGFTGALAFGARFTRHLAVEAGAGIDRIDDSLATFTDVPIAVSLVARLPLKQAELAAYAGVALHLVHLEATSGRSDETFGGHVGLRAGFNLWPTTLVGLDLSAYAARATLGPARVDLGGVRLAATLQHRF